MENDNLKHKINNSNYYWRSVKDEMPVIIPNSNGGCSEEVLVWINSKKRIEYKEQRQIAYYTKDGWCYQNGELMNDDDMKGVTHWMPLPPSPMKADDVTRIVDDIDVTKCLGCRKGIGAFTEKDGEYFHFDLFATPEAGAIYKCENSETIGKYLIKNGDKGIMLPNEIAKEFFNKQEMWWEDIISLAHDTLKEQKMVSDFFNQGEKDSKTWNLPNVDIENKLLSIAYENGIDVNEEIYPDLIKWAN